MQFLFGPGSSSIYSQILQLSLSLSPSAVSWVGSICLGLLAQLMNGHSACLLFLASSLQHSSINVYLAGVRALHIEQGFANPRQNCLRLQRVIRGIKRTHGIPSSSCLPITDDLMLVTWMSLHLKLPNHCMFRAACTLGYFGFLQSAEFSPFTDGFLGPRFI